MTFPLAPAISRLKDTPASTNSRINVSSSRMVSTQFRTRSTRSVFAGRIASRALEAILGPTRHLARRLLWVPPHVDGLARCRTRREVADRGSLARADSCAPRIRRAKPLVRVQDLWKNAFQLDHPREFTAPPLHASCCPYGQVPRRRTHNPHGRGCISLGWSACQTRPTTQPPSTDLSRLPSRFP